MVFCANSSKVQDAVAALGRVIFHYILLIHDVQSHYGVDPQTMLNSECLASPINDLGSHLQERDAVMKALGEQLGIEQMAMKGHKD